MGPSTKTTLLSSSFIEKLIDDGNAIVIYHKAVLKLDTWLRYHPGGDKTILHLVGRDATDQIDAYFSLLPRPLSCFVFLVSWRG
jgi:delta8-fatty-acid desaturase